ncbi:unnamed protein product [Urochloa humidicola]
MSCLSAGGVAVDCKVQKGNAGMRVSGLCRHECNCATSSPPCERVMCSVVDVVQKLKKQRWKPPKARPVPCRFLADPLHHASTSTRTLDAGTLS